MQISNWSNSAIDLDLLERSGATADGPALTKLKGHAHQDTMDTATSNPCCSQTQTQGPGCCQINGAYSEDRRIGSRLWPA
jgi:hypothetical protein